MLSVFSVWGTAAAALPQLRLGDPALCGSYPPSHPTVLIKLGDFLCFFVCASVYCFALFCVVCCFWVFFTL